MESLQAYYGAVINVLGEECLCEPTEDYVRISFSINAARPFPGCAGNWVYLHFVWKKCPIYGTVQFKWKEKKQTVVLEAVADREIWICGTFFGCTGSLNDINIIDQLTIVQEIMSGKVLTDFEYEVNGRMIKL